MNDSQNARLKSRTRRFPTGLVFLLPALLVFGTFQWFPILRNFLLAFQDYVPGFPAEWVGLRNFRAVLSDPALPLAARNTLVYVGICLLMGYFLPVAIAIALTEIRKGRGFFRLAIYVPNIIPAIAVYIIWRWLFNPEYGLLNMGLSLFGLEPAQWILSRKEVLPSLALMATWQGFGATAVLYMASLTAVSPELYEAAELDGAGVLARVRYVTIPAISGTMSLLLILQLIATFQVLQEPFTMTGGGPNDSSLSLMLLVYRYAFDYIEFGKAGALGSLLFLCLLAFSIVYVRRSGLVGGKGGAS